MANSINLLMTRERQLVADLTLIVLCVQTAFKAGGVARPAISRGALRYG